MALSREGRAARTGRGGRGRGGGGGGGKSREVALSHALSKLLRHQAASAGIQLDSEGFAPLNKVLKWGPVSSLKPTFAEIAAAVRDSDKQRFALKPDPATNPALDEATMDPAHWLIRANQGHSIKLDSEKLLRPIALPLTPGPDAAAPPSANEASPETELPPGSVPVPETVVHGTYFAFWPAIVASGGLRPMGRNHVHCSTGLPPEDEADGPAVVSGMRRDAEMLVYVDVAASMREAGIKWWVSDNGVVLTEGDTDGLVPARFFREVRGRAQGVGLLWKDGQHVADLPDWVKAQPPRGKVSLARRMRNLQ
ncbi:KptA family-domain-containing protein [Lasiosphaeria ovina]|uniref:2'-phosphotransferase n=1 Tax=Lasiosphaeria ovina TaxID=92902 RepID=A0AAE0KNX9_9PEZI|nr:KptA family-domain-containing protein [Lasiosphaeria ovina]